MPAPAASSIQPFRVDVPDEELEDLRERLARTRWPDQPEDAGWERGMPLGELRDLAEYWRDGFDWRAQERVLNAWPQLIASHDGQPIHFFHVTSGQPDALPLLLVHGWPSSPVEFLKVIGPLTAQGFNLVIPSLPGYGFSSPARGSGWGNLFRVAQALATLMHELGYERYGVHGTDVGSGIAGILATIDADHVVGGHLAGTVAAMPFGPPIDLDGLEPADRVRAERFNAFQQSGIGYLHLQATRPQTIAYSLVDSPVGQLAWILDRFWAGMGVGFASPSEAFDRDQLLTNVSIYWFTRSGASTANAVYEGMQAWRAMATHEDEPPPPGAPMGVAVFGSDTTIRSIMDPAGSMTHWSEFDHGGHFAAMETPELLAGDLEAFFAPLRDAPA